MAMRAVTAYRPVHPCDEIRMVLSGIKVRSGAAVSADGAERPTYWSIFSEKTVQLSPFGPIGTVKRDATSGEITARDG